MSQGNEHKTYQQIVDEARAIKKGREAIGKMQTAIEDQARRHRVVGHENSHIGAAGQAESKRTAIGIQQAVETRQQQGRSQGMGM